MIPPTSVKCKYCGRWFGNASGRTKHIGVYHPRGESNLRQAFRPNTSTPSQQVQPVPNPPTGDEPPPTDGSEPQSMDFDMEEHNDNGTLTFLSSSITLI